MLLHFDNDQLTRHEQVLAQIRDVPLSKIYIQYNEGYKNCEKTLKQQTPIYDVLEAYKQAFTHALNNNYNRVLIFEDDAIIDVDRVYCPKTIQSIKKFIEHNNPKVYSLGAIPALSHPLYLLNEHRKYLIGLAFHAVLYNESFMRFFTTLDPLKVRGKTIDAFVKDYVPVYGYHQPLIYQTFPSTENKEYWGKNAAFLQRCIAFLKLHKQPQPGFDRAYMITDAIWYVVFSAVIISTFLSVKI